MSGHNRWSKIKRQKAAMGASKGKLFNKLIKELTVAAGIGGGDPTANFRLRGLIDAAREANMPRDQIDRAIKRGTGEIEGAKYEEATYEGYGPGGVALVVECLTDNKNRTASEVRTAFSKGGGNMAAAGAVAFTFARKGSIQVKPGPSEEKVMEVALEGGAEDVLPQSEAEGGGFEVRTDAHGLHAAAVALEKAGVALGESKLLYVPQTTVKLEGETAQKALKLVEWLEDLYDVQNVYANFEIDDAELAKLG